MKLLAISGALRAGSTNTRLLREAIRLAGEDVTAEFADIRFPLYDGDLEEAEGVPAPVVAFSEAITAADAVIVSTPEYNKNLSGVLKNALDWLSRKHKGALAGKPVAIMSAASGRAGGERSQFSLRHCLTPFNPDILQGPELMLADARNAFDEDGRLTNERSVEGLSKLMTALRARVEAGRG
jgi:chromate reductase